MNFFGEAFPVLFTVYCSRPPRVGIEDLDPGTRGDGWGSQLLGLPTIFWGRIGVSTLTAADCFFGQI